MRLYKWHEQNQASQVVAEQAHQRLRESKLQLCSIVIYWALTYSAPYIYYGLDWLTFQYSSDTLNLAHYLLMCTIIPAIAITYLVVNKATLYSFVMFMLIFLTIENAVMTIDAAVNTQSVSWLELVDTVIQGSTDSLIPFGLSDVALTLASAKCMKSYISCRLLLS